MNITGTFENCTSLEKVTIGDGVKEIQIDTFAGSGIKELNIPDSVTSLGKGAAYKCASLEKVTIGNNVTVMESMHFIIVKF